LSAISRNKDKLINQHFLQTAQSHLVDIMHMARSFAQFQLLSGKVMEYWREHGENTLADWFQNEYMTYPHDKFCYSASGVHGVLPNNNIVEVTIYSLR
jgi:hypothetical protein